MRADGYRFGRSWLHGAAALVAAIVIGGLLLVGGAPGASKLDRSTPKLAVNAVLHPVGGDGLMEHEGIFYAKQQGQRMGIIAILIGVVPEHDFALRFSRKPCSAGAGGFAKTRRQIPFTSDAQGQASIEQQNLARGLLRRSRSVVLVTPEGGNQFQACGTQRFSWGASRGWELKTVPIAS